MLGEALKDLQQVFCTQNLILPLTCSGTGGLEAALVGSVPQGKKAICLVAGKFGERWKNIAKAYGIEAVNITVPYGQAVQPEQLEQALAAHPDAVAVCATLSEDVPQLTQRRQGATEIFRPGQRQRTVLRNCILAPCPQDFASRVSFSR